MKERACQSSSGIPSNLVAILALMLLLGCACTSSAVEPESETFILCALDDERESLRADISTERRQEILNLATESGIASGGSLGSDSQPVEVNLYVRDEESLQKLSAIAEPSEVCVTGQDPEDYVEPGPQLLAGDGWRWLGSAEKRWQSDDPILLRTQLQLEDLWAVMPSSVPIPEIDFEDESVLVVQTNRGVDPGGVRCGFRFEGVTKSDDLVVARLFVPGGEQPCTLDNASGLYAVALDHGVVGSPPFDLALQYGPRAEPVYVGSFDQ
jgi:hypothetical protein